MFYKNKKKYSSCIIFIKHNTEHFQEAEEENGEEDAFLTNIEQNIENLENEEEEIKTLEKQIEEDEKLKFVSDEKEELSPELPYKFDPTNDDVLLREMEEAEKQAKATAQIINELKKRITELVQKEQNTEIEARELEEKSQELKIQMILFEEKTKTIQLLLTQSNLYNKLNLPELHSQKIHGEDCLPKVVVCGVTESNIPKLILCDKKHTKSFKSPPKTKTGKDINIPMVCKSFRF